MDQEIKFDELNPDRFVQEKTAQIRKIAGEGKVINALSGGVDSSVVTLLGHRALGDRLLSVFVQNGLMREGEPERVVDIFHGLGVPVKVVDASDEFFSALKEISDPEEKREAITQTFYRDVFGRLVRDGDFRFLLQGTILTDIDETVAGIKRQHNVFAQLGIHPEEAFGYRIIEPLVQLRKDGVRKLAEFLGLPAEISRRIPFPGPALSARVIGEVTPERIQIVRTATRIVENLLRDSGAFQYMAILHHDRVTGIRHNKREFGYQIELRCWDSVDARTATPTHLPYEILDGIVAEIIKVIPEVVSVTHNITPKPPSTIEAV